MTLFSYAKGGTVLAWSSCAGNPRWTAFPAIVQIRAPEPHKRINNVPRKPWQSTIKPHFQHRHPSTSSRDDHIRRTCVGTSFLDCWKSNQRKRWWWSSWRTDMPSEQTSSQSQTWDTYITDLATIPWPLFFTADTTINIQNCALPQLQCLPKLTFRQRLIEVLAGS